MKLPFRQGLVRYQTDTSRNPVFLQKSDGGSSIDLVVSPDPTIITFTQGSVDYLFEEKKSVPKAWTGFQPNIDYWLYWDFNILTTERTFSSTTLKPLYSIAPPPTPHNDQHWFDLNSNTMKVWNGLKWITKIRVFAGLYQDGSVLLPHPTGSQVGLNQSCQAGYFLYDDDGKPIKRFTKDNTGSFITTETKMLTQASKMATVSIEATMSLAEAFENIPAFYAVTYKDFNKIGLASYRNIIHPAIGVVREDLFTTEVGSFITKGYVSNVDWDWTQPPNTPVFCGITGEITTSVPQIDSIQQIGIIVSHDTIFVDIQPQIILNQS